MKRAIKRLRKANYIIFNESNKYCPSKINDCLDCPFSNEIEDCLVLIINNYIFDIIEKLTKMEENHE